MTAMSESESGSSSVITAMPAAMSSQQGSQPVDSSNNVDLEDGEIDDDDDDEAVPAASRVPAQPSAPATSGPSTPRAPTTPKSHDTGRREQHDNSSTPPWAQRRSGPPNANKMKKSSKTSWGPPHKKSFTQEEEGDDFAIQLEKALQEKAREKAKQAVKDKSGEEGEAGDSENDDHWSRKRRKRRKSKDEDGERESKHRKKRREGEEDEDDMIFVRGASPHHDLSGSPPYRDHDRSYDSYGEEEEDYDGSPDRGGYGGYSSRGRGRGGKIVRGRGRGRIGGPNEGGRGSFSNKRGTKRGNLRGGPVSKPQRQGRDRPQDTICMYFMQGKCPKDADECPYSHDAMPRRKMELCKFYNMNCCAKREKCLYMHKDFPCKFFHTGRRCESGDNCRFSHDKLTDITRTVLLKHIELAPKEILGEFRRLTREQANQIIDRAAKLRAEGKNPEGMDLLRVYDEDGNDSGDDRSHTPMPSSPNESIQNDSEIRRNRVEDSRKRDYHDYNRDRERNRDRNQAFGNDRKEHSDRREHRERKRKRRWDTPDGSPPRSSKLSETQQRQYREPDDDEKTSENKTPPKRSAENAGVKSLDGETDSNPAAKSNTKDTKASLESSKDGDLEVESVGNAKNSRDSATKEESSQSEKLSGPEVSGGESGEESQDSTGVIPAHLPKRQRELFLRIQQQQREAEHNEDSKNDDSEADAPAEDDWYSSDDDGPSSLTDVLKNLKAGQSKESEKSPLKREGEKIRNENSLEDKRTPLQPLDQSDKSKTEQPKESPVLPARRPPLLPTPTILTDLMKNTAIDQLLSTIRHGQTSQGLPNTSSMNTVPTPTQAESTSVPVGLQSPGSLPSVPPSALVRDPRLSRDPRNRSSSLASNTSPSASPSSSTPTDARSDPRVDRQDVRSDPRSERRDPRAEPRHGVSQGQLDSLSSPRSDQRGDSRQADPRAARTEIRRSSEGSSSSTGSNPITSNISIYESCNPPMFSGAGDVDLRVRNLAPDAVGDTDFRRQSSQLGAGDMDMRRDLTSSLSGANAFPSRDTDYRFRMSHSGLEPEGDYAAASHSDMDLRRMQMMLPFKPAPVHTPATEINASLSSYTPAPYRVFIVDIPKPDFSSLKINPRDPQVKLDPRLRRVFGLNQTESDTSKTPTSPTPETSPQTSVSSAPLAAPSDPRRRNSNSSRPADPRQSRLGAGAAPSTCPPTPRTDEYDEPTMADTDLRLQAMYGRPQNQWENFQNRGRGLLPHPDPTWVPNATPSYGSRLPQAHPNTYHQQRSYTPPPT